MARIDFWRKKGRKYPIKRDEYGKSARQWCFQMFADGVPLQEIIAMADVTKETVYKYHQQWLKDSNFKAQISYMKTLLDKANPRRQETVDMFAMLMSLSQKSKYKNISPTL